MIAGWALKLQIHFGSVTSGRSLAARSRAACTALKMLSVPPVVMVADDARLAAGEQAGGERQYVLLDLE